MSLDVDKLRIGVLGCASIAERSIIPAIKSIKEVQLVAVASRTKEKAESFATKFDCQPIVGYESIVRRDDIDALYIPLPTGMHEEWVIKSLKNGKHVLTEKSLATNVSSARRMLEEAKKHHLVLMEDFMYRYHSQHSFIWDQFANGIIGELRLFKSTFGFPPLNAQNFRYNKDLGGGALLDAGAYTVDVSRWYLGNDLKVASSSLFVERSSGVCIHGSAALYSEKTGLVSHISFGFDNFYQCNYELWGSEGRIFCERSFTPPPNLSPTVKVEVRGNTSELSLPADNHFINIVSQFAKQIRQREGTQYEELYNQSRILTEIEEKASINYI